MLAIALSIGFRGVAKGLARLIGILGVALIVVPPAAAVSTEKLPTKLEFIGLLKRGDYDTLERRLVSIQRAFETGVETERRVNRAFGAFAYADPGIKERLDDWVGAKPRSYAARLARGIYRFHLAILSRGQLVARYTHPEQFAAMRRYLNLAGTDFETARSLRPRLAPVYQYQILMAKVLGNGEAMFAAYRNGVEANPDVQAIHFVLLSGLDPRWSGSRRLFQLFEAFFKRQRQSSQLNRWMARYFDLYRATNHYWANRNDQALKIFDRLIADGDHSYLRYSRARTLRAAKRYKSALRDLERGYALNPENPDILIMLGRLKQGAGSLDEAVAYYDAAIRLDPYNPDLLIARSLSLARIGRVAEGQAGLDRALYFGNYDARVHAARGDFFFRMRQDMRSAAEAMKRATDLAPHRKDYWYRYSLALQLLEDCDYITVSARYLEMCFKSGTCGRIDAVGTSRIVGMLKKERGCTQDFDVSHLRRFLVPRSNVRGKEFLGTTLGDSIEKVRNAFPEMQIKRASHPRAPDLFLHYSGRYKSEDGNLSVVTKFSRGGRLVDIWTVSKFVHEGTLREIADRVIGKYGEPDRITLGKHLEIKYLQANPDDPLGRPVARLKFSASILRTLAERCALPDNLRVGLPVARVQASLIDHAAVRENAMSVAHLFPKPDPEEMKRETAKWRRRMKEDQGRSAHKAKKMYKTDGCDRPEGSAGVRRGLAPPTTPSRIAVARGAPGPSLGSLRGPR